MNRNTAAARLGLTGEEDSTGITRAYGERLGKLQQQLVAAHNDAERHESQVQLAELIEAYEFLTGTGRYARTSNGDVTRSRPASGEAVTEMNPRDTLIRLETGAVLSDRIEVGPMLGQGGMGNVYAARDRLKDENVAIKVLRQDLMWSSAAKERFLAEAKVSCNFSHPNIVNVYDVGVSGGNYYFTMELLKGQTLRQRIEKYHRDRRLFAIPEVNEITRQLVEALRYAHRYIVHRDIKPENIWLEHDGTVKLMDFGIARAYSNSDMTQTGMTLGTAYYMAPEQRVAAKEVDWRADQYSLGIVLYELMAGTVPMGAAKPLEQLRRDLPKAYCRALMRAISPRPEDRWPSLSDLFNELCARQRKPIWASAAVLATALIATAAAGTGGYLYYRNLEQTRITKNQNGGQQNQQNGGGQQNDNQQSGNQQNGNQQNGNQQGGNQQSGSGQNVGGQNGEQTGTQGGKQGKVEVPIKVAGNTGAVTNNSGLGTGGTQQGGSNQANGTQQGGGGKQGGGSVEGGNNTTNTATIKTVSNQGGGAVVPPDNDNGGRPIRTDADQLRMEQCIAQCGRDDGECRSITRRGKQDCNKAAAFNSAPSPGPARNDCKFFGSDRCQFAADRDSCLRRIANRYQDCMRATGGSMISQRQDCDKAARDADFVCLTNMRECRASCQ